MAGAFDIKISLNVLKDIFTFFRENAKEKKENFIQAHKSINSAFILTYDYLRNKNGAYIPKPELAEAWNQAASAVMKVNPTLGDILHNKSHFWLDPDLYQRLNRDDDVIKLNQIVDEMERMRRRIK